MGSACSNKGNVVGVVEDGGILTCKFSSSIMKHEDNEKCCFHFLYCSRCTITIQYVTINFQVFKAPYAHVVEVVRLRHGPL